MLEIVHYSEKFWGPLKSETLDLRFFSLMVNPRLGNVEILLSIFRLLTMQCK